MSDESLLGRVEKNEGDFTLEAWLIIDAEVMKRGGLDALKQKVAESGSPPVAVSTESPSFLRRFYPLAVLVAYGSFMYAIDASLWFYWLCLFALIASLFALLFRPPLNPEDEIAELASGGPGVAGSDPPLAEPETDGDTGFP